MFVRLLYIFVAEYRHITLRHKYIKFRVMAVYRASIYRHKK